MKMILWCVPLLVIYEIIQCLYIVYVIIKNTVMTCETFSVQAFLCLQAVKVLTRRRCPKGRLV